MSPRKLGSSPWGIAAEQLVLPRKAIWRDNSTLQ